MRDSYTSMISLKELANKNEIQVLLDTPLELLDKPKILVFGNIGWYNYMHTHDDVVMSEILQKKGDNQS